MALLTSAQSQLCSVRLFFLALLSLPRKADDNDHDQLCSSIGVRIDYRASFVLLRFFIVPLEKKIGGENVCHL